MAHLITKPNLARPDDVFEWLSEMNQDVSGAEASRRLARLVICLANHIGDEEVVREAIAIAKHLPEQ